LNEPDNKFVSCIASSDTANTSSGLNWDSWEDVKKYAAVIIPIIRKNSDNIIVVGTPTWSQDVDIAAADPISGPNIAYTLHFYAAHKSHQDSLRIKAQKAVDLGAALFVTEFGTTIADGGSDGFVDSAQTKIWLDWADSNSISWVNWSIVDKGEASAALKQGAAATGGWTEDKISTSGNLIRDRLKSRPAYDFSDIIPVDGKSLQGRIEAESFKTKSDALKSETTSDAGGGQNLGYTSDGAWAEYLVIVRKDGDYKARLRVATDQGQGGTITMKIGDKKVASWTASTGGWSKWQTTENCSSFKLAAGETTLRIEWSGTASSLVNLNWIDFICNTEIDTSDTTSSDTTTSDTTVHVDGKSLPGIIEAESLKSKSEALTIEQTSDTEGKQSLGYTTDGAWAEYPVIVRKGGKYSARLRVAADQSFGGTITMKIADTKVALWTIASTGGWSTWKTTDSCDKFELAAGETTMRIEWSGTASSLVNLNWIEFTHYAEPIGIIYNKFTTHKPALNYTINNGLISLSSSKNLSKVTLLSLSGKIIKSVELSSQQISLPIGNVVQLLLLTYKDGSTYTIKVSGIKK
jgi:endoglucanase